MTYSNHTTELFIVHVSQILSQTDVFPIYSQNDNNNNDDNNAKNK